MDGVDTSAPGSRRTASMFTCGTRVKQADDFPARCSPRPSHSAANETTRRLALPRLHARSRQQFRTTPARTHRRRKKRPRMLAAARPRRRTTHAERRRGADARQLGHVSVTGQLPSPPPHHPQKNATPPTRALPRRPPSSPHNSCGHCGEAAEETAAYAE